MNENTIEYRQKKQAIADGPHIPTVEISEIINLSRGTIHRIIHERIFFPSPADRLNRRAK